MRSDFWKSFRNVLAKFGLTVHPGKTRLIEFGKYARRQQKERGEGEPETFTVLGFTQQCGATRTGGNFALKRTTVRKRMEAKLQEVKQDLRQRMHEAPSVSGRCRGGVGEVTGRWLGQVLNDYYQYHAIPGNMVALKCFRERIQPHWRRTLRRRSQRRRFLES